MESSSNWSPAQNKICALLWYTFDIGVNLDQASLDEYDLTWTELPYTL